VKIVRQEDGSSVRVIKAKDGVDRVLPRPAAEAEKLKTKLSEKRSRVGPRDTPAEATLKVTFDVDSLNPLKVPRAKLPEE